MCGSGFDSNELGPIMFESGRQFIARGGQVSREILGFLPHTIDDLVGREALIAAGTRLVDAFRDELLDGRGVSYAQAIVPPAFAQAVDDALALDLFAASVALIVRLCDGGPAGCLAEEIVAVTLIEEAKAWLEMQADLGHITPEEQTRAEREFGGLFDLFDDDDVLDLFAMTEPGDAALAGSTVRNLQLRVVDQRIEAWFKPFGGVTDSGYLGR